MIRWRSRAGSRGEPCFWGLTWVFASRVRYTGCSVRYTGCSVRYTGCSVRQRFRLVLEAFVMVWKNTTVHSWGEPAPFLWVDLGFCGFYLPDVSSLHGLLRSG